MDSLEEFPPAKKQCCCKSRIRFKERVRQFQLPQQFPSTLKQAMKKGVIRLTGPLTSSTLAATGDAKCTAYAEESQVPLKVQKMRILSSDGRDLGEFNVKLHTDHPANRETVAIIKSHDIIAVKQPENIPSPMATHTSNRPYPRILKQGTAKIPKKNLMDAAKVFKKNIAEIKNRALRQQCSTTPSTNGAFTSERGAEASREKQTCNDDVIIEKGSFPVNRIHSKYSMYHPVNKSSQKLKAYSKRSRVKINLNDKKIRIEDKSKEKSTDLNGKKIRAKDKSILTVGANSEHSMHLSVNTDHRKIGVDSEVKCDVNTLKKLDSPEITIIEDKEAVPCINKSVQIINIKNLINTRSTNNSKMEISGKCFKVSKGKCIATIKNTGNGIIVTSLKNATNIGEKHKQIDRNLNERVSNNINTDHHGILNDKSGLFQAKSDLVPKMQKDMTITSINDKTLKQNTVLTQDDNITSTDNQNMANIDHSEQDDRYDDAQNKCVPRKESGYNCQFTLDNRVQSNIKSQSITSIINANTQPNIESVDCSEDSTQKNLSERWSIISKAMESVKDDELREQALKALEDCGIGIKRHVPICPPEERKAVHDTQVQTTVFSLLDPKSFILMNKDLNSIQKVNEISLYDMVHNPNEYYETNVSSTNSLQPNDAALKISDKIEEGDNFDIDSFLAQVLKNDSDTFVDVLKMKETLSTIKVRCKNLLEHLQKDFINIKQYNEHGMLNIHNAIISNNMYLVQRQLMVLQQCKESVDILTEDGMTSLELAIKYDRHEEIVKLLLEAGAQVASSRCTHDSVLIIASKQSSPLLPMLVARVSDPKLLDQMDSEGLAALHYCSIRGNVEGAKALLSAGASINLRDMKSGRTPLFHAIDSMHVSVAQALIKVGAIVNIANYAGQTPLPIMTDTKSSPFRVSLT